MQSNREPLLGALLLLLLFGLVLGLFMNQTINLAR